jgi:subtilase family serine protease
VKQLIIRPVLVAAVFFGTALAAVTAVSASTTDAAGVPAADTSSVDTAVNACDTPQPGFAQCLAKVRRGARHKAAATDTPDGAATLPAGYGPADLQSAYNLGSAEKAGAGGRIVAVVDGNDDPTAEADLAVYRSTYGLPACTTANGCFRKVNQEGQAASLPQTDGGWAVEISLDLDAVSAACPGCKILLVEGDDASAPALAAAENTAVALGASAVSNSYSIGENNGLDPFTSIEPFASAYDHPGVAITASSGDLGYQLSAGFPADLSTVVAVGGTTLNKAKGGRGWSETVWGEQERLEGAGSACSAWIGKPAWQHDKACPGRTIADVSADADPRTGLAVYDTTPNPDNLPSGWIVVGGTSASSPFIAGVYVLAGHTGTVKDASGLYAHSKQLNDVTSGSNTEPTTNQDCPATSYICTGMRGYDAPTGLGTPNGTAAF